MDLDSPSSQPGISVESLFIRERNVLLTRAEFTDLFVDYFLHLADLGLHYPDPVNERFKALLSGAVLHAAARPWNEQFAWTVNLQDPPVNLFVTANNHEGTSVGTIFTDHVQEAEHNVMFAEVIRAGESKRRSVVDFHTNHVFAAIEHFYRQSEQRIGRFYTVAEEEFWFLSSQPDCDVRWLLDLTKDQVIHLEMEEETSLLETRTYRWHCGCEQSRMFEVLLPAFRGDSEVLFQGEDSLRMQCPRCGKPYLVTREGMEAYAEEN